jgi:hypothetical protein
MYRLLLFFLFACSSKKEVPDYTHYVEGDGMKGYIEINGKAGTGVLRKGIEKIKVKAVWNGYGELEATDTAGNVYQLIIVDDEDPGPDNAERNARFQ